MTYLEDLMNPVNVTVGVALSNNEDIRPKTSKGWYDGRYVYEWAFQYDTNLMEIADEGENYKTWVKKFGDEGIIVITIEKA